MAWKGKLLSAGMNAKTVKSDLASEYETAILYLAPHDQAGGKTLCPFAKQAGCDKACLYKAGMGVFSNVQQARIAKAQMWLNNREQFVTLLKKDIRNFVKYCERKGKLPAVRLNGTSDIMWERELPELFSEFNQVQFYDYTKIFKRAYVELPANYKLTLSYSGANPEYAANVWKAHGETGINIAVVYRTKELRDQWVSLDHNVIDGDETDLRFLDEPGKIVGLYAKGPAKKDQSGFVVD